MSAIAYIIVALVVLIALPVIAAWAFSRRITAQVEKAAPPAGRFVAVQGGRIHMLEAGSGAPIVLIHGLGGNLHNFTYVTTEPLARDYRVIAIDRPGCGYSERARDEQARIPEQARMIADMLEREGVPPALIVGHSLGGAVALALGLNHAERAAGLALIAPLATPRAEPPDAFKGLLVKNPLLRRLVAHTVAVPLAIRNGAASLAAVFAPDETPEDFGAKAGGLLSLRPRAFYAASTDLVASGRDIADISARLGALSMPVGVMYGAADEILDAEENVSAIRTARPDADIEILEGRGHMPMVVEPELAHAFIARMAVRAFAAEPAAAAEC